MLIFIMPKLKVFHVFSHVESIYLMTYCNYLLKIKNSKWMLSFIAMKKVAISTRQIQHAFMWLSVHMMAYINMKNLFEHEIIDQW